MPDEEVKIRLTLEGQRKIEEGTATLQDLYNVRRELIKLRKDEIPGTKEYLAISAQEVAVKEKIATANQAVLTANGKMMQSYFRMGAAVRGIMLNNVGLISTFADMNGGIGKLSQGLTSGIMAASGLSSGLRQLGVSSSAVLGGVGAFVIGLSLLITKLNESKEAAKKAREEYKKSGEDLISSLEAAGIISSQQMIAGAKGRYTAQEYALQQMTRATEMRMVPTGKVSETGKEEYKEMLVFTETMAQFETRRELAYSNLAKLAAEIAKYEKQVTSENEKQADLFMKNRAPEIFRGIYEGEARPALKPSAPGRSPMKDIISERGLPGSVDTEDALAKQWTKQFDIADKRAKQFTQDLRSGLTASTGQLAQGFVKAFGLGQDLASQLIATLLSAFATAGLNFLLSFIPGFGPAAEIAGAAGSSRSPVSDSTIGLAQSTRSNREGTMQPQFTIVNEITAKGLSTFVERGNRQNARSRV